MGIFSDDDDFGDSLFGGPLREMIDELSAEEQAKLLQLVAKGYSNDVTPLDFIGLSPKLRKVLMKIPECMLEAQKKDVATKKTVVKMDKVKADAALIAAAIAGRVADVSEIDPKAIALQSLKISQAIHSVEEPLDIERMVLNSKVKS